MNEVTEKNTMTSQIRPHLSVAKHGLLSNSDRAEAIQCCLHKLKPLADTQSLMRLHDAVNIVHEPHDLQPHTLTLASLHVFHATAIRAYTMQ